MKTITLDYETYENELNRSFKEGSNLGDEALKEAKEILIKIARREYEDNLMNKVSKWISRYGDKL